jgi:hypothetical protein
MREQSRVLVCFSTGRVVVTPMRVRWARILFFGIR